MENKQQVASVQTDNQVEPKQTEQNVETGKQEQLFTQSDLDLAVTKALKTSEKSYSKKMLEKEEDWKQLYETEKAEKQAILDDTARKDFVIKNNLTGFANIFKTIPIDQLDNVRKELDKSMKSEIERQVNEKLSLPKPISGSASKVSQNIISDPEAYKEMRKKLNIQ